MKLEKLPTKLTAEPLLDALCEMRFASTVPASGILPGILFKELGDGGDLRIEALPISQIPVEMRRADPMLQNAPLVRLLWKEIFIGVGDSSVTVSLNGKYPGWSTFKSVVVKVMEATIRSSLVTKVDRYSMKYVDLIPFSSDRRPAGGLDLTLRIGNRSLTSEAAQIRVEVPDKPFIHIIQAITLAEAVMASGEKRHGAIVDIDTISTEFDSTPEGFVKNLPTYLDAAHTRNKRTFFECLTEQTLQELGPVYE